MNIIEADKAVIYEAPMPHKRRAKILIDKETVGAKNLALGIAFYEPGEKADFHTHDGEETMYILHGQAIITVDGKKFEVKKGMTIYIPAGEQHMLENPGRETFHFLFIFTPPGPERAIRKTWKRLLQPTSFTSTHQKSLRNA